MILTILSRCVGLLVHPDLTIWIMTWSNSLRKSKRGLRIPFDQSRSRTVDHNHVEREGSPTQASMADGSSVHNHYWGDCGVKIKQETLFLVHRRRDLCFPASHIDSIGLPLCYLLKYLDNNWTDAQKYQIMELWPMICLWCLSASSL